jgi:hypothetical protein
MEVQMGKHITTGQLGELIAIDKKKDGIGEHVQELIRRLTSGGVAGKSDDIRVAQAKRYWDLGVGRELDFPSFKAYLASIPEIPEALKAADASYPNLVLVETRIGLKRLCDLGNIAFEGNDETFVAYDDRHAEFTQPTWIRIQDGRKNRNRSVKDCRKTFAIDELGLTALQGVCSYLQHSTVVTDLNLSDGHVMDLSGSVPRDDRGCAAYLIAHEGRAVLYWNWCGSANLKDGSASRREG